MRSKYKEYSLLNISYNIKMFKLNKKEPKSFNCYASKAEKGHLKKKPLYLMKFLNLNLQV